MGASILDDFHPAVTSWFRRSFAAPTPAQESGWGAIASGTPALIAAPTGSGKTLAAFLSVIDALVREALAGGGALPDETRVIYVSPLKALSHDIDLNLQAPLSGIKEELTRLGLPEVELRTALRTGDTTTSARAAMLRKPPHILVTTPESLYILLTSARGRPVLSTARTVTFSTPISSITAKAAP